MYGAEQQQAEQQQAVKTEREILPSCPPPEESFIEKFVNYMTNVVAWLISQLIMYLREVFKILISLLLDPKFLFICWALFLYLGIDTVFFNYENTRPAVENYKAWAFWLSSVIVAIFIINIHVNSPDPTPSPPVPPEKPKKLLGLFAFSVSSLVLIFFILFGVYHYYNDESFQKYRSEIKKLDCKNHIQDFLERVSSTDEQPEEHYFSELLHTRKKNSKEPSCTVIQTESYDFGFLKWLWFVGEYYGASGSATVVWDHEAIEARATWIPIYSTWYKKDSTWTSRIQAAMTGEISCSHTSTEKLKASLNKTPFGKQLSDGFFKVLAELEESMNEEFIKIEVRTGLIIDQFERSSTTLGPEWMRVVFERKHSLPSKDEKLVEPFDRDYICKERLQTSG